MIGTKVFCIRFYKFDYLRDRFIAYSHLHGFKHHEDYLKYLIELDEKIMEANKPTFR